MELKDIFKFKYVYPNGDEQDLIYTAEKNPCGGRYKVTWDGGSTIHCLENVKIAIEKGSWRIVEELPEKFVMVPKNPSGYNSNLVYTMTRQADGSYKCEWYSDYSNQHIYGKYTEEEVKKFVFGKDAYYEIKEEEPVKNEYPELKTFMRVKNKNGEFGIVVPYEGEFAICYADGGWNQIYFEEGKYCNDEFEIIAVYDAPANPWQMLSPETVGVLVWKRKDDCKEKEFKERLDYYETHIKAAQEALQKLQDEYQSLKQAA